MNAISKIVMPVAFTMERWLSAREMLLPAIERLGGTHTETDVVAMLMAGQLQFWLSETAAHITEFRQYPRLKEISTFVSGGDMESILQMKPDIERYGHNNGCTRARIEGRRGWERVHKDYDFLSVSLVKEI